MRLEEILDRLPLSKVNGLMAEFGRSRQELPTFLARHQVFRAAYQELPRGLRHVINFVSREGGDINYETLREKKGVTREDLAALQARRLLFVLPDVEAPEAVVVPHEYIFMVDLPEDDPASLVTGLKLYDLENLKKIASFLGLNHDQPKAGCASSIYLHVTQEVENLLSSLSACEREIVGFVCQWDGIVETDQFIEKYPIGSKDFAFRHSLYPDNLVGRLQYSNPLTEAQRLFLRTLLIPVADKRWRTVRQIAVPRELAEVVGRGYRIDIAAKRERLHLEIVVSPSEGSVRSNQLAVEDDLKRLFLAVENIGPRSTRDGMLYKIDLKKVAQKLNVDDEYLQFLLTFARLYQMIDTDGSNIVITANALAFLDLSRNDTVRLLSQYLLDPPSMGVYTTPPLFEVRKFVCDLLLMFEDRFVDLSSLGRYAALLPNWGRLVRLYNYESLLLEDEIKHTIKLLFWLGFAERGGEWEAVRLSSLGRAVLRGEEQPTAVEGRGHGDGTFIVQPTLEVIVLFNAPFDVLLMLARIAEITSLDRSAIFRLSRTSIQRGMDRGLDIQDIADFLETRSRNRLPQTVLYLLEDVKRRQGEVEIRSCGGYLRVKDSDLMAEVRALLGDTVEEIVAPQVATLRPGASLEEVEERLRRGGYFPRQRRARGSSLDVEESTLYRFLQPAEYPFDEEELTFSNPAYSQEDMEEMMEFAVHRELQVEIAYVGSAGRTCLRVIEPELTNSWMVEAFCHLRRDWRVFRLDRIRYARLLPVRRSRSSE